jgi:hypothetical protein
MPKKPTKTEAETKDAKKVDEGEQKEVKSIKPPSNHTFLKVDKSHRPAGFHCDELNTSYAEYEQN